MDNRRFLEALPQDLEAIFAGLLELVVRCYDWATEMAQKGDVVCQRISVEERAQRTPLPAERQAADNHRDLKFTRSLQVVVK